MKNIMLIFLCISSLTACSLNPQNADMDLTNTLPEAKESVYSEAISKFGMMTAIYGSQPVVIMNKDIADNTSSSTSTSFEIPRNISEMVKSTLVGFGGAIHYIDYDPESINNGLVLGILNINNFIKPAVMVSGGITEFDRGLVTKGDSINGDVSSGEYGVEGSDKEQASLAQVTLDFNMINFNTRAAFARIQAINSIHLHKALKEDSFAFTIKSMTFGLKGTMKKVQGRHEAVRLLVQLSMLELLGRYTKLPYWRLIPNVEPDEVVLDQVKNDFYQMTPEQRIAKVQTWLYLLGFSVHPSGHMDAATTTALAEFNKKQQLPKGINEESYLALFENVPIDALTFGKARGLNTTVVTAVEPTKAALVATEKKETHSNKHKAG